MVKKRPHGNSLKQKLLKLLRSEDLMDSALQELLSLPPRKALNPLFSFLYYKDDQVKWRSVTAIGILVERLANEDMEKARVIMRRLMWNLNDESGGIGWGSPEAMGEILARHEGLAAEYAHILLSYTRKDGNYLEYQMLQRGLLWGIGRMAQIRPELVKGYLSYLLPYLESTDATVRGTAAWVIGLSGADEAHGSLEMLYDDEGEFTLYNEGRLMKKTVKDVAKEAAGKLA